MKKNLAFLSKQMHGYKEINQFTGFNLWLNAKEDPIKIVDSHSFLHWQKK
ncbi:hypothetical protein ACFL35_21745 [Candidatus Riflebacteria bacterium]